MPMIRPFVGVNCKVCTGVSKSCVWQQLHLDGDCVISLSAMKSIVTYFYLLMLGNILSS